MTLVVGHSHLHALGVPGVAPDTAPSLIPLDHPAAPFEALTGWLSHDAYWKEAARLASGRTVAILYNGNQHLANFLFAHPLPFDLVLSKAPHLATEEGAAIVPELAVRNYFSESLQHLDTVLARLRSTPGCRPIVLGTPPPKGDDARLRSYLFGEPYFCIIAERLGVSLDTVNLTPRLVRFKLWHVIQDLLALSANAHGVEYFPVPKLAMTAEGFLAESYWAPDATHANREYGRILLDALAAHLQGNK